MRIYSQLPVRAGRQVVADALLAVWVVLCVRAALAVHRYTLALAEPGRRLADAGRGLGASLSDAANRLSGLPLVGDDVRGPLDAASRAAGTLVRAGQEQQQAVERLALVLALVVAVLPILAALVLWGVPRIAFVRRARAAQRFVDADADLDLFALRAMANQPMHVLARVSDDPAGAWRRGDAPVIRALAVLELRAVGLRPPPVTSG
ncbi:hypothetical protein ACPPVT_11860 [Angustibacter sp. McL0619]|uniref:hypothetical protein n=1 Tax=Angustibacter sp. McL0619 TaxID=3415676 RepID=UPI003CF8A375